MGGKDQKKDPKIKDNLKKPQQPGVSRREFLKISGLTAAVPLVTGPKMIEVGGAEVAIYGPGKTPAALIVNGRNYAAQLEPRVTLLDALRNEFELTGAKRVCDRGTCGACTVLMQGKPVYSCSVLAIEAQGKPIITAEGLLNGEQLHPVQQAFIDNDAQQCGFCTPGFVVACKALLDKHPQPTAEDIRHGLSGNFCRCGTYAGIRKAVMQAAASQKGA